MLRRALTTGIAVVCACGAGGGIEPTAPGVAFVRLSAPTLRLIRHDTLRLSATAVDTKGLPATTFPIVWASDDAQIAEVTATGLVTAVAPGTVSVRATAGGVSATATVRVDELPAPLPVESGVLLRDTFDDYSSVAAVRSAGFLMQGVVQLVPGRSGNALRFPYTPGSFNNFVEYWFGGTDNPTPTTTLNVRYAYRTSPGADPTCGNRNQSGFKWFMLWRPDGHQRYTQGVGSLNAAGNASPNAGLEFTSHDNSSTKQPNPFLQNVTKTPRFGTTNDGQWHWYTLHAVTGNGGYEQIWIDDVLVLDNRRQAYDHDDTGIVMVQWPGTMVSMPAGCDFYIDIDDVTMWK